MVPAEPAFPLGLQEFAVDLVAKRAGQALSQVNLETRIVTKKMGRVSASAATLLHASPGGGLSLNPNDAKPDKIDPDIHNLGWASLFLGDSMDLGRSLGARVELTNKPADRWD